MVSFKAVAVLAKWPGFKCGFKVCFSIRIFPSTDDILFQTGFRVLQCQLRQFQSPSAQRGFNAGFRTSFKVRFQPSSGFKVRFQTQFQT